MMASTPPCVRRSGGWQPITKLTATVAATKTLAEAAGDARHHKYTEKLVTAIRPEKQVSTSLPVSLARS